MFPVVEKVGAFFDDRMRVIDIWPNDFGQMILAKWRRVKQENLNCNEKVLQEVFIVKVNKVMYIVSCF